MANRAELSLIAVGNHVADRAYLLGDTFTAADIMMGYSIQIAEMLTPERIPENLRPYWQRLNARPAFAKAKAA